MRVRFNKKMIDVLTAQHGGSETVRREFESEMMEAQNEPRPGRLNTRRLLSDGTWSYRTYSWRDLEVIA